MERNAFLTRTSARPGEPGEQVVHLRGRHLGEPGHPSLANVHQLREPIGLLHHRVLDERRAPAPPPRA